MGKVTRALTGLTTGTVLTAHFNEPADIVLINTEIKLQGSKIKIFGSSKNLLATFDSKKSTFTVNKKLIVGQTDVIAKLKTLEERIKNLES